MTPDTLAKQFCKYSVTDKLFESGSFPPALWEVFEAMKSTPMTIFEISDKLHVSANELSPIVETLLKDESLTKQEEVFAYGKWKEKSGTLLAKPTEVTPPSTVAANATPKNVVSDTKKSSDDIVAVDIKPESSSSTELSFDIG